MIHLSTERLTIEALTHDNAAFILDLVNTPSWLIHIGDRNVHSLEEAKNYIDNQRNHFYKKYGYGLFCLRLKESGKEIGLTGFLKRSYLEHPDLGFAILPDFEGHGYVKEAAFACIQYGKKTLKFEKIQAITSFDNERSKGLLKKLGFRFVSEISPVELMDKLELFELS